MFGRTRKAALRLSQGDELVAWGVVKPYDASQAGNILALGIGSAGVMSGSTVVQTPSGPESALGGAIDRITAWTEHERSQYLHLPIRVLALVSADQIRLYEWTMAGGAGQLAVSWPRAEVSVRAIHFGSRRGVEIGPSGRSVILTTLSGPHHRRARRVLDAMLPAADAGPHH